MGREAERPHFQISISQLEAIFDQGRSETQMLGALDHELSFRKTARVVDELAAVSAKRTAGSIDSVRQLDIAFGNLHD
jgi:hypothetical protein